MTEHAKKRLINRTVTAIFAVTLFLFIIAFSIGLPIINRWFYYIQIKTLGLEEISGKSYEQIKQAYDEVLDYLLLPGRAFGTGVFAYSAEGAAHFADCKGLFIADIIISALCGAAVIAIIVLSALGKVQIYGYRGRSCAFWTAIASLVIPAILSIFVIADFEKAFEVFHHIFFPGKTNWVFDSQKDEIITVLPEQFFANCAIFIGIGLVAICGGIICGDILLSRKRKKLELEKYYLKKSRAAHQAAEEESLQAQANQTIDEGENGGENP